MVIGVGTDLIKIDRLVASLAKRGDKFARPILTESEFAVFRSNATPSRFLAKRFAAKEAASKALGTGIGQGVSWQHIAVVAGEFGAPLLEFSGRAAEVAKRRGVVSSHISISDEKDYAIAFVVLSGD